MNIKKFFCLFLCIALALCMFTACGGDSTDNTDTDSGEGVESEVTPGGTMLIGMGTEPITLNPNGKVDSNMGIIAPLLFSKLMTVTATGNIVCDLAESYELSEDNLSYTFHLPENVKFSDGEPMTSNDVKFSFEEIVKQGGQAAGVFADVASIECPDDNTVVITLNNPNAAFLGSLGYDGVYILPE
ncbi:MAG: ABC transporter substrate-binding protein, partial [Firmicutes bacterium]|nr:ABC transporter substrate-binding protein [Bacillota bacterium]